MYFRAFLCTSLLFVANQLPGEPIDCISMTRAILAMFYQAVQVKPVYAFWGRTGLWVEVSCRCLTSSSGLAFATEVWALSELRLPVVSSGSRSFCGLTVLAGESILRIFHVFSYPRHTDQVLLKTLNGRRTSTVVMCWRMGTLLPLH